MKKEMSIIQMFPQQLRHYFEGTAAHYETLSEIRIRCMRPVLVRRGQREYYVTIHAEERLVKEHHCQDALVLNNGQVESIFIHLCQYSPYAYGEEL